MIYIYMSILRKTIKDNYENIKKKGVDYEKITNVILKANDILYICSHFYHAYLLFLFENNKDLPNIDSDFFRMCFKAISKKSSGPKPKGENLKLVNELELFYNNEFVYIIANAKKDFIIKNIKDIEDCKFDAVNLSYIIDIFEKEMEISMKNNIIINFFKYVHQYVNQHFIKRNVQRLTRDDYKKLDNDKKIKYNIDKKEEDVIIKELRKELMKVKNDLCLNDNNLTSDFKYHKWIIDNKKIIFPIVEDNSMLYEDDIKINYCKYLKHMLLMNSKLEENNKKMFSAIPLRTEITDKYITLNSSALKDIFGEVDSGLTNEQMWKKYFNINEQKHKLKDYSFNFQISTDGYSVSINFIKNDKIEKKQQISKAKSDASIKTKQLLKGKTEKEKEKFKEDKKADQLQKQIKNAKILKELKATEKKAFKKKSKEEQEKITLEIKLKKNKYEYIEDAVKNPILKIKYTEAFDSKKICVVDPGMRAPMTILGYGKLNKQKKNQTGRMMNDGKILFSYSSGARINAELSFTPAVINLST